MVTVQASFLLMAKPLRALSSTSMLTEPPLKLIAPSHLTPLLVEPRVTSPPLKLMAETA